MGKISLTKRNLSVLAVGIILDALGVAFTVKSDFGISAVSSVAYTLSCLFPKFTLGVWSYLFQFGLFVLMCVLIRKCSIPYIFSFLIGVIFGYTLDLCSFLVGLLPESFILRLFYFAIGTGILITGVSFLMISDMPIMPQDLFTREVSSHFFIPFKYFKTGFDISCVSISLILAVLLKGEVIGIGIGTVVNAFIIGKGVDTVKSILTKKGI